MSDTLELMTLALDALAVIVLVIVIARELAARWQAQDRNEERR